MSIYLQDRDAAILKMFKRGGTCAEVGKAFGISRQRAHQIKKALYPQGARQELDSKRRKD